MDFQRFVRFALNGVTRATTTIPRSTAAAHSWTMSGALSRPLSTSASRLAPPPPPPSSQPPATDATASWPPKRASSDQTSAAAPKTTTTTTTTTTAKSVSGTTASNPLTDRYTSDNPAQWATWSSDDFHRRHLGDSSSGGSGRGGSGVAATTGDARVRLRPITGRTTYVGGSVDAARAFVLTEMLNARNKVRSDFREQRFHMRPGLKRKYLRDLRRKRNFNNAVKTTVGRVHELVRQGW